METYPEVNALVSVEGKDERFTIFSVYWKKKTADLKSYPTPGNPAYLLQDVPWADISYLNVENQDGRSLPAPYQSLRKQAR
jgi:hypothetical protein